ncbi:MAG: two-component sensor histidine kinase [Treponema sp.]|nr:two-component sensor histidine kinase [Treponema sp.]
MNDFVKKASRKISKLSPEQLSSFIDSIISEKDRMDSILSSLSTGLIIVDCSWKIIDLNKSAERLLPFRNHGSDIKADTEPVWTQILDNDVSSYLKKCAEEERTNVNEEFSIQNNDSYRFITLTVVPLVKKEWNDDDEVTDTTIAGSIITIEDITEKRQQEILLHRMESLASLTNLAASVAHEIKNPLGAISIHIQLLQKAVAKARKSDGMLPSEKFMENYISVINEEIDNLNKIVVDFLFAVRPVQANLHLVNPDELLSAFIQFYGPELENKNIMLSTKLSSGSTKLLLDEKLFREVIINITQNALYAIQARYPDMESKLGEIVIETFIKNDFYYLTIADNGCGMDAKTAEHIFEPYYTTKANGTGLGLTTVYKIIKEFRGDIDVKSVQDHGTVFTIKLPVPQNKIKLLADNSGQKEESKA